MIAAEVGGYVAGSVGVLVALIAAVSQLRQVHIAQVPGMYGAYSQLFADLNAEIAWLHEDMAASRAAEKECREITVELRARIGALEQTIEEMTQ